MAGEQAKAFGVGSVQWSIVLQLFCCHGLILAVAVVYGVPVFPVIAVCLLSFLLLLNIPYNLHVLEMTLERLSRGISVEPLPLRLRWPLTRLFVLVNVLGQQTGQQEQREQRNVAYRDQLLQQVSKTAAQEERNRLTRDLHDSIKQQIYSIVVNAAVTLLDLSGTGAANNPYDVPPIQLTIPYVQLSLVLGGIVIVCLVALLLITAVVTRPSVSQTLRLNED